MSKAPEWIYLDGDVEAGDGMFPRCFENPKYASEPQVEYVRVDLAEAAEQQGYASAIEDARKLHEARIEELEAEKDEALNQLDSALHSVSVLEKRVEGLEAENARLREALTPSQGTKSAYIGEFKLGIELYHPNGDSDFRRVDVPWTTIKEIMAAIRDRAALQETSND